MVDRLVRGFMAMLLLMIASCVYPVKAAETAISHADRAQVYACIAETHAARAQIFASVAIRYHRRGVIDEKEIFDGR
jgi:hypothetical protein